MIKKKKKKEANKSPFDHIYTGSFWASLSGPGRSISFEHFFHKKFVFFFAVSHCSEFHRPTHSGNWVLSLTLQS
jgi:hypothetical protein